jgi:hypothetical protein
MFQWLSKIRMQRLVPVVLFFLLFLSHTFAWGYTGHRIIAEIAEQFLAPETAHQIRDLLAGERDHAYRCAS